MKNKKVIILIVAVVFFLAATIFSGKDADRATGKVATVTMKPAVSVDTSTVPENTSSVNPYKTFSIEGEMPEEYVKALDEYLKDDLEATQATVLDITGKFKDETVYYCIINSYDPNTYVEVCTKEMGTPCVITEDTPSVNTGITLKDLEKEIAEGI